jgi:hypothetical protein
MNKLASIVSLFLLAQIAVAGHHESGHMKKSVVIGYEISDEGEKLDIVAGDPSLVKIWVDYVEAHNQRDLIRIDLIMDMRIFVRLNLTTIKYKNELYY